MEDYIRVIIWTIIGMGAAFLVFWGLFRQMKNSTKRKKELEGKEKM